MNEQTTRSEQAPINEKFQIMCVWAGPVTFFLFFLALFPLMEFIPPVSPSLSGEELMAKEVGDNIIMVRLGVAVGIFASVFWIPFSAVISLQMSRIEGPRAPILSITQFGAGIITCYSLLVPFLSFAPAFYREHRDPALIQLANDTSWLQVVMIWPSAALQVVCIGMVGLLFKKGGTIFPRWYCYYCFWAAFSLVPGGLAVLFQHGPFAWNGLLAFWLAAFFFPPTMLLLVPILTKAIRHHKHDYA